MSLVLFKETDSFFLLENPDFVLELAEKANFFSQFKKGDFVGIKIHFGEKGNKSFIKPEMLKSLVDALKRREVKLFIFDTNTLYRGERMNAIDHIQIAYQHGFGVLGIPIIIGDGIKGDDYIEVEINKKHFSRCFLASIIKDLDYMIVVSHFTGHMLTGFGASLKNLGMGCASRRGKLSQHSDCSPQINPDKCKRCGLCQKICPVKCIEEKEGRFVINEKNCIGCAQCIAICPWGAIKIIWSKEYNTIQEKMIEYAYAVVKKVRSVYLNFCIFITKDCDCMNKEEKGIIKDLGILCSYDPVSIDKASIDLINEREKKDFLKEIYPHIDYQHQLRYAHQIGVGTLEYQLKKL